MAAHHKGLFDLHPGPVAHFQQRHRLFRGHANGFFAKHMFAGFSCFDRPRHMQMIGQRIINRFDFRVGQQLFVRSICFRNPELSSRFLGSLKISRRNGRDFGPLASLHCGEHFFHPDIGGA